MYQWISASVFPLRKVNSDFQVFANETARLSAVSSQTIILESYLNEVFAPYFPDPINDRISIKHGVEVARETYNVSESPLATGDYNTGDLIVYNKAETPPLTNEDPAIFFDTEEAGATTKDFNLILPISIVSNLEAISRIEAIVNRYVIDTKKYEVIYG